MLRSSVEGGDSQLAWAAHGSCVFTFLADFTLLSVARIIRVFRITQVKQKMTTISVSLTRAHKIAERLKAQATQLLQEATVAAHSARLTSVTSAQAERLNAQGKSVSELIAKAEVFTLATAKVRALISRENEARGISSMLAHLDAHNKLAQQLKSVVDIAKAGTLELSDVPEVKLGADAAMVGVMHMVNVVPIEQRQSLQKRLDEHKRKAVQLSDEIAEANAARVSIELDDELAAFATGSL